MKEKEQEDEAVKEETALKALLKFCIIFIYYFLCIILYFYT